MWTQQTGAEAALALQLSSMCGAPGDLRDHCNEVAQRRCVIGRPPAFWNVTRPLACCLFFGMLPPFVATGGGVVRYHVKHCGLRKRVPELQGQIVFAQHAQAPTETPKNLAITLLMADAWLHGLLHARCTQARHRTIG